MRTRDDGSLILLIPFSHLQAVGCIIDILFASALKIKAVHFCEMSVTQPNVIQRKRPENRNNITSI